MTPAPRFLPHFVLATMLALLPAMARAAPPGPETVAPGNALPDWDRLTPAQRELLVAPLRERWNRNPDARDRMYRHAQRWQAMSPEQRGRAWQGLHRWQRLDPGERQAARALFGQMRTMSREQRRELIARWRGMSPQQRRDWVAAHPPAPPGD